MTSYSSSPISVNQMGLIRHYMGRLVHARVPQRSSSLRRGGRGP
jgi:hypothetical protein